MRWREKGEANSQTGSASTTLTLSMTFSFTKGACATRTPFSLNLSLMKFNRKWTLTQALTSILRTIMQGLMIVKKVPPDLNQMITIINLEANLAIVVGMM